MFDFGIVAYEQCRYHLAWYVRLRCGVRLYVGSNGRAIEEDQWRG